MGILFILFACVVILLIIYSIFINLSFSRSKTCIIDLSINSDLTDDEQKLISLIERRLNRKFLLVILQDDINFHNSKFYWPRGIVYIHLSDFKHVFEKYNEFLKASISKEDFEDSLNFTVRTKMYFKD